MQFTAMKYTLLHRNKSMHASSDEKFVTWIRHHDLQHFSSNEEFMKAYSTRKGTFENIQLRSNSPESFVQDLVKNNLLKKEAKSRWKLF